MSLDEVQDIELLRKAAKLLEAENLKMARAIAQLKKQIAQLSGKVPVQLELQLQSLEAQLAQRNKALFGDRSEKRPASKESEPAEPAKQTGHGRREQLGLAVEEEVHTAPMSDTHCKLCGGELSAWDGQFEESEEIDVIERRFVLKKHRRQKYKCGCGSCIQAAPGPVKLFDGARYSPAFAAHVAVSKYADHLPLERQVRTMARDGLTVDSQTLWDQLSALGRVLQPAYDRLGAEVLSAPVIGVDETHWRLMGEKGKKQGGAGKRWQVWAAVSDHGVHYRIEDSRSAEAAARVLGDYAGTILCDDYAAYRALEKRGGRFTIANCWAHVRRKYVEVEDIEPGRCTEVLDLIGKLYDVERAIKDRPPDERLHVRRERSKPILLQIQRWALEQETLPGSPLRRAIEYMGGIWKGLGVFLDDSAVDLDNNRTERALRGVVLGRKNHYGSRSVRGTEVAALFYSLIESAKLVGIDPSDYLLQATRAALSGTEIPLPHELG